MVCRFKRHYQNTVNFSRNRRTLSNGLREPNPPTPVHKASKLCVVECDTQCVIHQFIWGCYVFETIEDFSETSSL